MAKAKAKEKPSDMVTIKRKGSDGKNVKPGGSATAVVSRKVFDRHFSKTHEIVTREKAKETTTASTTASS